MKLNNKHVEEKIITREEFERTTEHPHKFFTIYYRDEDDMKTKREYLDKYNVKRLLNSDATHDCKIVMLEIVEDE